MSLHGGSVFSRLSKRSAIRDSSPLAVHLANDNAMRRLLRDGVGINGIQKKYLSLCYTSQPGVRPDKDVAQGLGRGELVWNLTACEKKETMVIATLLTTKEACTELRSLVISAGQTGCPSVRKRAAMSKSFRGSALLGSRGGSRGLALEKDPEGQVELFVALCKALPHLDALRSLELERLRKVFHKPGAGAARLARGLKGNSKLKSLAVRHVRLADSRALGVLSSALSGHPSLVTLSLGHCGLAGESGGRLASSVIRAHAGRRDGMVWSAGLRRPSGVVGNTAAAAPARIATAGCLAVDLSGNQLGDAGVRTVARGLQSDTWLVGLNLSHNQVTDRGAAVLSVCLQHNATLCALVLDGNPDIGQEAERRITVELEARSMMPEAVLEEPEVVLTLASWGFSAHASHGSDASTPPPPPSLPPPPIPPPGSDSAVSDISENSYGGGGGGGGGRFRGGGGDAGTMIAATIASGILKTPGERNEEMVRDFRRWAGYSSSSLPPAPPSTSQINGAATAGDSPVDVTLNAGARQSSRTVARPGSSGAGRGRARTAVEAAVPPGGGDRGGGGGGGGGGRFIRARSLSSRSTFARTASGSEGGRAYKRSRSSAPEGRTAARSGTRAERAPWGAGPRVNGARARAQAWARAQLSGGGGGGGGRRRCSGSGTGRRSAARNLESGYSGAGAGVLAPRGRVRGRRGRAAGGGCSGGVHTHGRRRSTTPKNSRNRDNAGGGRKTRRRRGDGGGVDAGDGVAVISGRPRRRRAASALDVTRDVLESGEEYPVFAPRRGGRGSGAVVAAAEGGGSRGGLEGGRTDRVVTMLAALEEVVMGVCKEMWRLEDKIEDTESIEATGAPRVASEMENQGESSEDDREEVAVQVEACLRDMWRDNPGRDAAVGGAAGGTGRSSGGGNNANNAVSPSRFEDERVEGVVVDMAREALLEDETDGEEGGGTQDLDAHHSSEVELEHGGGHMGEDQQEEEDEEDEEDEETLVFGLYQEEDRCSGGGGGPEAERPVPSGIGGEGWRGPVYEEYEVGEEGDLFDIVLPPSALPDDGLFGEEEEPAAGHPLELEGE